MRSVQTPLFRHIQCQDKSLQPPILNFIRPFVSHSRSLILLICSLLPLGVQAEALANIEIIAFNCFNCHGHNGASQGAAPPLKGLPAKYLQQTLKDYKQDKRPGTIMPRIAKGYTEAEINAVAEYFAKFKTEPENP